MVLGLAIALAPYAYGQQTGTGPVEAFTEGRRLGIKGGVSAALMAFPDDDARPYLGYDVDWLYRGNLICPQVGVFVTVGLSKRFALQPEIHYVERGLDASTSFLYEAIDYRVKIRYLELPVLMKLKSPFGGAVHPALYAGAYTALKLGAKKVTRISGKKEKTALPNLRRFDYGLAFGVETEWRRLLLDVRLNLGLADVMTELDGAARLHQHEGTVKNLTPVVMTGFRF